MPELPEVETVKCDLEKVILNKKITSIEVLLERIISPELNEFIKRLRSNSIIKISRRGKLLIFHLEDGDYLLGHLKMTGQFIYREHNFEVITGNPNIFVKELPNKHTRVIFTFADESKLFFNDIRTFGYLKLINKDDLEFCLRNYGPYVFTNLEKDYFLNSFKNRKTNLKAFLLNQKILSGIGNIYVDEICFDAKIRPTRLVSSLTKKDKLNLYHSTKYIINLAVEHRGTSFSDYVDARGQKGGYAMLAKVYKRDGQPCYECQELITKIRLAGRGTHYCQKCQK